MAISKINISNYWYVQKLVQLFKTKNGGWRQRTKEKMKAFKAEVDALQIFWGCWPVDAEIKNACHGSIGHCRLQYIIFIPDSNSKTILIKYPHTCLKASVAPSLLGILHSYPLHMFNFTVSQWMSETPLVLQLGCGLPGLHPTCVCLDLGIVYRGNASMIHQKVQVTRLKNRDVQ